MKEIILFTNHFPYGNGENWIYDELNFLEREFRVQVIPLTKQGEMNPRILSNPSIKITKPLYEYIDSTLGLADLKHILTLLNPMVLRELWRAVLSLRKINIWKALHFVKNKEQLFSHSEIQAVLRKNPSQTILYFFWGVGASNIVSFLPLQWARRTVIRYHGYDLYFERNDGYIPFRRFQLHRTKLALMVSDNGKKYLENKFAGIASKLIVARLGTRSMGLAARSNDDVLRIVSCSSLIPLKRVGLIADALKLITQINIEWLHIGSGPEWEMLNAKILLLGTNIKVTLAGQVVAEEIPLLYANSTFDLFLQVSGTEGLPVSIMEAFAAGIPVYATNVGGVGEIVDDSVGSLLDSDLTAQELARKLVRFANGTDQYRNRLRINAYNRFLECCDSAKNSGRLVELFKTHF